jgi:hypothetical protein
VNSDAFSSNIFNTIHERTLAVCFVCNQGTATFDTPEEVIGSGEFRISRLTSLYHSRCSGGLSDDTPSDKCPEKLDVRLVPARDDTEFSVEVENVPADFYPLMVGDIERGQIEVVEIDGKLKGKLKFKDPQTAESELLDFDPRGEIVEVFQGDVVILESLCPNE